MEGVEGVGGYLGRDDSNDDWIRRAIGASKVNQTTVISKCLGHC